MRHMADCVLPLATREEETMKSKRGSIVCRRTSASTLTSSPMSLSFPFSSPVGLNVFLFFFSPVASGRHWQEFIVVVYPRSEMEWSNLPRRPTARGPSEVSKYRNCRVSSTHFLSQSEAHSEETRQIPIIPFLIKSLSSWIALLKSC